MSAFDELSLRTAPTVTRVTDRQLDTVRARIQTDLATGRDAWPAVQWLALTGDDAAKWLVIAELDATIDAAAEELLSHEAAADNAASDVVFGRAAAERRRIGRAFDFAAALRASLPDTSMPTLTDLEFEEAVARRQRRNDEHEARIRKLNRLGVQHGEGLPYWELYMRRRRHKNWGS